MKNTRLLLTTAVLFVFACKKSNNAGPNTASALPTSFTWSNKTGGNQVIQKDTLIYDSNQRLKKLNIYFYESNGGGAQSDTLYYDFTLDPATGRPASYNLSISNGPNLTWFTESHLLTFDNQNRIITDSAIVPQNNQYNNTGIHYTYAGNNSIVREFANTYDPQAQQIVYAPISADTITVTNGNISRQVHYEQGPNGGLIYDPSNLLVINNYSSYANPLYNSWFAANLGVFFRRTFLRLNPQPNLDCISKNLPQDGIVKWTTDASGRVISGQATDGTQITYTY